VRKYGLQFVPAVRIWPSSINFLVECDTECTSEMGILVQLRKSLGAEFSRFMEINQAFEDGALTGVWGGSCGGRSEPGGMKFEIPGRILHRACTGNAERRWSVQGSSFPDARFLFLVGVSRSCMRVEEFSLGC
jgi:hypothetical protein